MLRIGVVACALAAAAWGAGCSDDPQAESRDVVTVLTPAEAHDVAPGSRVVVRGYVVAAADDVRLCAALRESLPPQCSGASIELVRLDPAEIPTRQTASGISWSDREVRVRGTVSGGRLMVTSVEVAPRP